MDHYAVKNVFVSQYQNYLHKLKLSFENLHFQNQIQIHIENQAFFCNKKRKFNINSCQVAFLLLSQT